MKRFSEQFKKQSERIVMHGSERSALRERLLTYMEYHPLPAELKVTKKEAPVVSGYLSMFKLNSPYARSFAGAFAVLTVLVVPFVAERSVPGDVLYPVKVQFNEEVRSSLSFSPYAKVAWETQRLERRISEARLLASKGKLTNQAEQEVAEAIKSHSDAAQRELAVLRADDSDEAAIAEITFASALAVQTEVLESHNTNIAAKQGGEGTAVATLAQVVAEARDTAEASQSEVLPSYDKLLGRVEAESTNVYELFASVESDASSEEAANVERRLNDIERKIAHAVSIREGNSASGATMMMSMKTTADTADATNMASTVTDPEAESVKVLRSALADIQKLMTYMTHIDVRRSVPLEDILPVEPTPEEQSAEAGKLLQEIVALQEKVSSKDVRGSLGVKVSESQQELEIKLAAALDLMNSGSAETALVILRDAHILASELDRLTEDEPQKEAPVLNVSSSTSASNGV